MKVGLVKSDGQTKIDKNRVIAHTIEEFRILSKIVIFFLQSSASL